MNAESFFEKLSNMFSAVGKCIYNSEHVDGTTVTDEIETDCDTELCLDGDKLFIEYNEGQTRRVIPIAGLTPHFQEDEFGLTFSLFRNNSVEHQFTFMG